jgi:LDH2 family malate/lactate/ureidoglycolate dehydrogenase
MDQYFDAMDRLVAQLRGVPHAAGHDAIYYPGEPEALGERRRLVEGIGLPPDTAHELRQLALESGTGATLLEG